MSNLAIECIHSMVIDIQYNNRQPGNSIKKQALCIISTMNQETQWKEKKKKCYTKNQVYNVSTLIFEIIFQLKLCDPVCYLEGSEKMTWCELLLWNLQRTYMCTYLTVSKFAENFFIQLKKILDISIQLKIILDTRTDMCSVNQISRI